MKSYKKAPGSKGISGAQKGSNATVTKSKPSDTNFAGVGDSRPKNSERKQSAL